MCYVRTVRTAPAVYCLRHGRTGRTRRQSRLSLRSAVASISPSRKEGALSGERYCIGGGGEYARILYSLYLSLES